MENRTFGIQVRSANGSFAWAKDARTFTSSAEAQLWMEAHLPFGAARVAPRDSLPMYPETRFDSKP